MLTGGRRLRPTARSSRWFRRLLRGRSRSCGRHVGRVVRCAPCVDATPRVPVRTAIAGAATIRIAEATQRLRPGNATYVVVLNLMVKGKGHALHAHRAYLWRVWLCMCCECGRPEFESLRVCAVSVAALTPHSTLRANRTPCTATRSARAAPPVPGSRLRVPWSRAARRVRGRRRCGLSCRRGRAARGELFA